MNSNYDARLSLLVEQVVSDKWVDAASGSHVLLKAIANKGRFNQFGNFKTYGLGGAKYLVPVIGTNQTADSITDSSAYTAYTYTAATNSDFSQAEYRAITYRNPVHMPVTQMLSAGRGDEFARIKPVFEVQVQRALGGLFDKLTTDLNSTTAESTTKVIGVRHALSASNTVGGIAQSSNSAWQSNVIAVSTTFDPMLHLTRGFEACRRDGMSADQAPDLILMYPDLYNKFAKEALNLSAVRTNENVLGSSAYWTFNNAVVISHSAASTGEIMFINSETWFFAGDVTPTPDTLVKDDSVYKWPLHWQVGFGCLDPKRNAVLTGMTV